MAERVLVVDDDPVILELLQHTLEREGYLVDTADGGLKAMEAIDAHGHRLVILDVVMPDQDGVETTFALKRTRPETQVIAITGAGRVGDPEYYMRIARSAGACCAYAKPLDLDAVSEGVRAVLGRG